MTIVDFYSLKNNIKAYNFFILFFMNEVWKSINEYETRYQISSLGRIKSLNWK